MTRDNLIQAIYDNADSWSCASPCQHTMENENPKVACWECAEKQLEEYEASIKVEAIETFVKTKPDILAWLVKRSEAGYGTTNGELLDKIYGEAKKIRQKYKKVAGQI